MTLTSHASFWEAVKGALHSLRSSKLRSFLTLLGIILSTTTLISVMGVFHGMDVFIAESATTMGTEGFRVMRFAFGPGSRGCLRRSRRCRGRSRCSAP